jgi:hypothetical protein
MLVTGLRSQVSRCAAVCRGMPACLGKLVGKRVRGPDFWDFCGASGRAAQPLTISRGRGWCRHLPRRGRRSGRRSRCRTGRYGGVVTVVTVVPLVIRRSSRGFRPDSRSARQGGRCRWARCSPTPARPPPSRFHCRLTGARRRWCRTGRCSRGRSSRCWWGSRSRPASPRRTRPARRPRAGPGSASPGRRTWTRRTRRPPGTARCSGRTPIPADSVQRASAVTVAGRPGRDGLSGPARSAVAGQPDRARRGMRPLR